MFIDSRSEGEKSFPRQNSISPPLGTGNNVNFEYQERILHDEIDQLRSDNLRYIKKAEYLENGAQNCNCKIDQNAVYYNDRISTLDGELLDVKRQIVTKDEDLFSLNNHVVMQRRNYLATKSCCPPARQMPPENSSYMLIP